MWLPALAGAHYQLRQYEQAVQIGRRAWALNSNWPGGLRYVVAGLGQLDRIKDAKAALAELRAHDPIRTHVKGHRQLVASGQLALPAGGIRIHCQPTLQISAQIWNLWVLTALCSAAVT